LKNIWHYKDLLPEIREDYRLSIGEGQTPLVRSHFIGPSLGLKNLYFKLENLNPTGSYKDRFAATFISSLLQKKVSSLLSTSSGNNGAALAAYSGAAGIDCYLVIVDGAPLPKIQQMQLYGGKLIMVNQFGIDSLVTKDVFSLLAQVAKEKNISLPISAYCYCPEGMQGVQTISYEILDELHGNVHHIFSPSGGGGLTLAVAKSILDYTKYPSACKVHCVQPLGNNTIAGPLRNGKERSAEITHSSTLISGLQVPSILDGNETLLHCRKTGGTGYLVDDELIFKTQKDLAQKEGIFCEPAGAVSVSALSDAVKRGELDANETVVCLITGSGFKDMSAVAHQFNLPTIEKKINITDLSQFLETIKKDEAI
jgi:threonine synthase